MKIIKYTRLSSGKYKVLFDNKKDLTLYEDVIVKYNLLYKKEINDKEYDELVNLNDYQDIYNKVINYIKIRLRSKKEITNYLKKMDISNDLIEDIIDKLIIDKYIDDERFSIAYIKDKYNFSSSVCIVSHRRLLSHLCNLPCRQA